MEVETPTRSNFDSQPQSSFPFSCHVDASRPCECDLSELSLAFNREPNGFSLEKSMAIDAQEIGIRERLSENVVCSSEKLRENDSEEGELGAALKLQKVYRSYRTRRRLADSAVVVEELWWQAIDYARLNRSTISFFNFQKPETAASRWSRIILNASKVGKGLSKDAKAKELAFQHWIEAIDPRHRYGHSLHIYYKRWCNADAGQPFFYWLDVGEGKDLDLEECPRSKLRQQCVKYLGPLERDNYEYIVEEGKIVHKQTGEHMDTTKGSQGAKWIFVMSTSKKLFAAEKKKGKFHHSSFLAGGATLAAGRLIVVEGELKSIWAYSGHYRPVDEHLNSLLDFLEENGINLNGVEIRSSTEEYENYGHNKTKSGSISPELLAEKIVPADLKPLQIEIPENMEKVLTDNAQTKDGCDYKRTLSGGLQSPRADVPKKAILQRINSKKMASSYQLGRQLSLKWTTGAGPRIGCVADYPMELRNQALEFVSLSPRCSPRQSISRQPASLVSPTSHTPFDLQNVDMTSFT